MKNHSKNWKPFAYASSCFLFTIRSSTQAIWLFTVRTYAENTPTNRFWVFALYSIFKHWTIWSAWCICLGARRLSKIHHIGSKINVLVMFDFSISSIILTSYIGAVNRNLEIFLELERQFKGKRLKFRIYQVSSSWRRMWWMMMYLWMREMAAALRG